MSADIAELDQQDTHTDDQRRWHQRQIDLIVRQWQDGKITTLQKRAAIADENLRYHGNGRRGRTGQPLTGTSSLSADTRLADQ